MIFSKVNTTNTSTLVNAVKIERQTLAIIKSRNIKQKNKSNKVDWKFNYFYDYKNRGESGIYDNGKNISI